MGLFGFKRDYLEEACSCSDNKKTNERVFSKKYDEVYLLTHPYYSHEFMFKKGKELEEYHEKLTASVIASAKRKEVFAILTLEHDKAFMIDKTIFDYYCRILKIMQKNFKERLHVRVQTGGYYWEEYHKLPIILKENPKVTARGIYGDRCVMYTLSGFSKTHGIPKEDCLMVIDESIIGRRSVISDVVTGSITLEEYDRKLEEAFPEKERKTVIGQGFFM